MNLLCVQAPRLQSWLRARVGHHRWNPGATRWGMVCVWFSLCGYVFIVIFLMQAAMATPHASFFVNMGMIFDAQCGVWAPTFVCLHACGCRRLEPCMTRLVVALSWPLLAKPVESNSSSGGDLCEDCCFFWVDVCLQEGINAANAQDQAFLK